jgi:hypothetical protein
MCDYLRAPNFLLPEDMAPDFSAVAVAEDGTGTKLFTLMSVRTDYVVLVYLPSVAMVGELLALRDNLNKFTEVRYYIFSLVHPRIRTFLLLFVYPVLA